MTEQKAADTILQKKVEIKIGNKTYKVAPPTVGTLIMASGEIAKVPTAQPIKGANGEVDILSHVLSIAKDCDVIGEILAILILGTKNLTEMREITEKKYFGLIKKTKKVEIDRKAELAKEIVDNLSPKKLNETLGIILNTLQIGFFFATINSLAEINLLKKSN